MSFAIVAEFPLGVYRGHTSDRERDPLPSPARLHAALLNAAAQGARAEADRTLLRPCARDREALVWLEGHAPDAMNVPTMAASGAGVIAYRQEGFFHSWVPKVREDRLDGTALSGPLAWVWTTDPPPEIGTALAALCLDVSHLGTADSPVILRCGNAVVTHRRDPDASLFSGRGVEVEVPRVGRTAALEAAHDVRVGKAPTAARDRATTTESATVVPVEQESLARVRYVALEAPPPVAPWPTVVLLPVDEEIPPGQRVAWCVALHRALISRVGDGAPTLITGQYEPGVRRPANRLAIQYVSTAVPAAPDTGTVGAFALLVPADADPADLAILDRAVRGLKDVRVDPRRVARLHHEVIVLPGDQFWTQVPDGHVRVWVTDPPAIPESRPVRGRSWTLGDAALLSVALVWRDDFERTGRRAEWYARLVDAVSGLGAAVLEAHKLNSPDGRRYVHHVGPETAVQPYRAALRLGTLAGDRTVVAIGQTRHLGGGLLTPVDLPGAVLDQDPSVRGQP
ncbi:MAG TPA: type I-U CRISPR-associated protein Csb2 [Patescibacteria group bacterium]|nr:type I-U CRISPR-associated protein Csb2 [Patescibacteria group bacterium]